MVPDNDMCRKKQIRLQLYKDFISIWSLGMVWPFLLDLVGASCPEDKVGRVLDCLLTPAGNHSDSALLSGNDVQEMGKYCK